MKNAEKVKLIELEIENNRLREELEKLVESIMLIRCINHINIPQQNSSEITGAECGACIAQARDKWKSCAEGLADRLQQLEYPVDEYSRLLSWPTKKSVEQALSNYARAKGDQ